MSAYIVEKNHIVFLIVAAMSPRILDHSNSFRWYYGEKWQEMPCGNYDRAAEVGNMLWRENIRSVGYRYAHSDKTFEITPRDLKRHYHVIDPAQVLKSCHCFNYQSCETDDWKQTESYAFIKSLESSAAHVVPGYDTAKWGAPEPMAADVISLSDLAKRRC